MKLASIGPIPPAVILRFATQEDREAMLTVMAPFRNRHFPGGLDTRRVQIAEVDGKAVGFVGWKGDEVLALYVANAWRGLRTVGPLLLAAAERAIAAKGYPWVRVMIDADAEYAHRFYLRADYETEPMDHDADVAWMTKRL